MKNRCLIVSGGEPGPVPARSDGDFVIACDRGYAYCEQFGLRPDLFVGDFDSFSGTVAPGVTMERLTPEKDDTDTGHAISCALERGYRVLVLLCALGGRLDHTLVNVYLLVMLREQGKRALLVDDYAEMELIGSEPTEISDKYPFYSLVNITGTARGITETGCKFPLDNGEIRCDYQYGTSNEVLPGQTAVVSVKEGNLLLIRDFPE